MAKIAFVLTSFSLCFSSLHGEDSARLSYNLVEGLPNIYITPYTEMIGHTWAGGLVWDKPLIQKFYSQLAAHNDFFVAIDLGAQTGSFTLLAKYFPNSKWYAFEPIHEAANALKSNLLLNGIENVSVYEMAASESPGKVLLKLPQMNAWGLSTIGSNLLRFSTAFEEREIDSTDLDSFVLENHIEKVHFMKLDTEGWELYILKAAEKLIRRDRPIILMEYNETNMRQCYVLKKEVDEFLIEMGYEWKLISSEDILCTPVAY